MILLTNVLLIATSLAAAALLQYAYDRASDIQRVELGRSLTAVPEEVAAGERMLNILLVGSDSSAGLDPSDPVQVGRQGERFGDVIIVAHIDERSGQIALLSFPRDLWLPLAGVNRSDRINRAFEVGGPAMLIDTVEQNFDLPIHHYVNVDFAGFQGLVEAVGSVDVYFETPARDWNVDAKPEPRSQTGFIVTEPGCHALDPPTALAYVRSRYYQTKTPEGTWVTDPTSDFGRISRQQDFLKRLMYRAIDLGARNPFVLADMVDTGLENVAIDESLTPQLLVDLGSAYRSFDPETLQTYSFPVVDAEIDGNQVLEPLVDQAEPILAFLRGAANDDPTTIDLSVVTPRDATAETVAASSAITNGLSAAGFDLEPIDRTEVAAGITINHGPNGAAAAGVVADALAVVLAEIRPVEGITIPEVEVAPVGDLGGRSIRLLVGSLGDGIDPSGESTVATAVGNSPQDLSVEYSGRNPQLGAEAAPAADFGSSSTSTDNIVGDDGQMANGSTSPTLSAGNRDEDESRGQPVDSNETACRST
ncbi:MAG: LCP family protein [Acidimicrobiia bacterium]|nr:LCP family protein [Acidimicrobiia bacterium]